MTELLGAVERVAWCVVGVGVGAAREGSASAGRAGALETGEGVRSVLLDGVAVGATEGRSAGALALGRVVWGRVGAWSWVGAGVVTVPLIEKSLSSAGPIVVELLLAFGSALWARADDAAAAKAAPANPNPKRKIALIRSALLREPPSFLTARAAHARQAAGLQA